MWVTSLKQLFLSPTYANDFLPRSSFTNIVELPCFKLNKIIRVCRLNNIDCKNEWQFERGIMGNCLVFDPSAYKGFTDTKKMSLSFSLGLVSIVIADLIGQ